MLAKHSILPHARLHAPENSSAAQQKQLRGSKPGIVNGEILAFNGFGHGVRNFDR